LALHHFEENVIENGETILTSVYANPLDYIETYITGSAGVGASNVVTNYEYEVSVNEEKRTIPTLSPTYTADVNRELEKILET
jgi:hypothetical protein